MSKCQGHVRQKKLQNKNENRRKRGIDVWKLKTIRELSMSKVSQ